MTGKKSSMRSRVAVAMIAMTVLVTAAWASTEEKVLLSFDNDGGRLPSAGLIFDAAGNLYGTTYEGGDLNTCGGRGCGTVFELMPQTGGGWTEKVLYNFFAKGGSNPLAALIFDSAGNLYGTTERGGTYGYGTVFELTPETGGTWKHSLLYSFNNVGNGGFYPVASLIFDTDGNLYGTATAGGTLNGGTVFELTRETGGRWNEKVLYAFEQASGPNTLIFDSKGNLYGTTIYDGYGSVFELTPKGGGGWTEKVLHTFTGDNDGGDPTGLIVDAAGNLYGTAAEGGVYYLAGLVFELTPKTGGAWTEKVLHDFPARRGQPLGGVIFDAKGNLYGTLSRGGVGAQGAVFELTPKNGTWTERILYDFNPYNGDGATPIGGLIFDNSGNLYGMTALGGAYGYGTVFELSP